MKNTKFPLLKKYLIYISIVVLLIILSVVNIFLTVKATGGKELLDFIGLDWQYFIIFLLSEIVMVLLMFFFAKKAGNIYKKSQEIISGENDWLEPFFSLDLLGGMLFPMMNDDEDMLQIMWHDGMYIDVGFIKNENTYYITTVSDDKPESWKNPLSVLKTRNRNDLLNILQEEIFRCRLYSK